MREELAQVLPHQGIELVRRAVARGSARRMAPQAFALNASIGSSYGRYSSLGPYRPLDTDYSSPRPVAHTHGLCYCGRRVVGSDPVWSGQNRSLLDLPGPG